MNKLLLNQNGEHHVWSRQNTVSMIKSRPTRNSRRAVLKNVGKKRELIRICNNLFHLFFSGSSNCIFYLLGTISYSTYNCICYTFIG